MEFVWMITSGHGIRLDDHRRSWIRPLRGLPRSRRPGSERGYRLGTTTIFKEVGPMHRHNALGIGQLDHVGVAVTDVDAAIKTYTELWGYTLTHREVIEDAGLELIWLKAQDMTVEL